MRYSYGAVPTNRHYTGQIWDGNLADGGIGLYFYNARYYDPELARFTQADKLVPNPANPQALNRYSYTYNNPIRYADSSGHNPENPGDPGADPSVGLNCQTEWCWKNRWFRAHGYYWDNSYSDWVRTGWVQFSDHLIAKEVFAEAGISFYNLMDWSLRELADVGQGVIDLAKAVGGMDHLKSLLTPNPRNMPFMIGRTGNDVCGALACVDDDNYGSQIVIEFTDLFFEQNYSRLHRAWGMVHELAHIMDRYSDRYFSSHFLTEPGPDYFRDTRGRDNQYEYWADAVAVWVYPESVYSPTNPQAEGLSIAPTTPGQNIEIDDLLVAH